MTTQQFLLEGAVYALEQSGTLLRDAVTLVDQDALSSAIVLAMFGREELGKYRLLREAFLKAARGEVVEFDAVWKECRHHITKQNRAALSISQRFDVDDPRSRVLRELVQAQPGTPEFTAARAAAGKQYHLRFVELPDERHELRMSASYVEPKSDLSGWERPSNIADTRAKDEVQDAVNDYAGVFDRLVRGNDDPSDFQSAFDSWDDRPPIPSPVWSRQT